jgi:hypothetical protein
MIGWRGCLVLMADVRERVVLLDLFKFKRQPQHLAIVDFHFFRRVGWRVRSFLGFRTHT